MTIDTHPRQILWELIKDIRFGMLTTLHQDGHLYSRPLTTLNQTLDAYDTLWFFVSRASHGAADVGARSQVNLAYAHPGAECYVSVSGSAFISASQEKKEQFASKASLAWFKGGLNDPDLALLAVRISHAHYWDVRGNKLTQLYEMGQAVVTGMPPESLGHSGEVVMAGGH